MLAELAFVVEAPGVILPDVLRHEPHPHLSATLHQVGHVVQVEEGKKVGDHLPGQVEKNIGISLWHIGIFELMNER